MFRHIFAAVAGLGLACSALAQGGLPAMFENRVCDYGTVPRGPMLTYDFRFTNNTRDLVRIQSVRVSCGCVTAQAAASDIPVGASSTIHTTMDTRRFTGSKTVNVFVLFSAPVLEEVMLTVTAYGRDDVTIVPDTASFGQLRLGTGGTTKVNLNFLGNAWQITEAICDSNYIHLVVKETQRTLNNVSYELTANLRKEIPVGKWATDIWVKTNQTANSRIRIPVQVEIEAALSLNPNALSFDVVKAGESTERKVFVRASSPFKVTDIKGLDDQLKVSAMPTESKSIHVLTFVFTPKAAGEFSRTLKIVTDLKDGGEADLPVKGNAIQ